MDINIELIIIWLAVALLGVLYFFAGLNGWKYPRLKSEFDNDNKKIIFRILKIIIGIGLVICGIGGIITEFIN